MNVRDWAAVWRIMSHSCALSVFQFVACSASSANAASTPISTMASISSARLAAAAPAAASVAAAKAAAAAAGGGGGCAR